MDSVLNSLPFHDQIVIDTEKLSRAESVQLIVLDAWLYVKHNVLKESTCNLRDNILYKWNSCGF